MMLGRRVREMRETRAIPVTQTMERKKSTTGRKGLANLNSLPRGMEFVDPLGLGTIDNRSLTLINDVSESFPASRHKPDDVPDPSIRDIQSKLKWIEEDPEGSGTANLHNAIQNVSLVAKRAFEPLFERQMQAEKIRSVQGMLQRFRTLFNLPSAIRGSISKGEYDLAVREYKKAKSIVLPSHLSKLLKRDYFPVKYPSDVIALQALWKLMKAPHQKSIILGTMEIKILNGFAPCRRAEVGILKRVLEEAEKVIQEFKGTLYKSMEDPQLDLTELENTVRLLLELEPESDPVWHYLNIQNRRIRRLLERCTIDHEAQMEALHNEIREQELSDTRWKQIQQDSSNASDINYYILLGDSHLATDSEPMDIPDEEVDALRARYIRRLTAVLVNHLPAFWRLALSLFSGKFAKSSHSSGNMLVDHEANAKPKKIDDRASDMKYTSHSLDEVTEMVHGTISTYETKVHNTFQEIEQSNILRPCVSDAIKEISKAYQAFEGKESAPPSTVRILRTLHMEITKIYMFRLCSWMRATTEEISKDELWIPASVLERNNSPYTITFMPSAFHSMAISAMDQINQYCTKRAAELLLKPDWGSGFIVVMGLSMKQQCLLLMMLSVQAEAAKSDDMFHQVHEIQESIRLALVNCFLDFAGYLEQLGSGLSQNNNQENSKTQNGYIQTSGAVSVHSSSAVVDSHRKLLMVLSNIGYCKDQLLHELYNKYKHIWFDSREKDEGDSDIQDLVSSFGALEDKVLGQYTYAKGIRDAAVELMHAFVAVHAEVFAGATPLLEKILGILVEGLIDNFLSLFHENSTKDLKFLDANGFCQFMLELEYFETILNTYFTNDAHESLRTLRGLLLEKASENVVEPSENPGHHRRPTRGSEEGFMDDRQQGMTISPDDLIALSQQHSAELLQPELERTRLNVACFMEAFLDSFPETQKVPFTSIRGSLDSPSFRGSLDSPMRSPMRSHKGQSIDSPSFSRHHRR
ncbi:hypothetical protein ACLOJK_006079 [Asimina triloba]